MASEIADEARSRTRRRLSPEERRREIVAAARALFASTPYHNVSISDIAREAGVTRALVHHYFGGVRDVYLAVLGEIAGAGLVVPAGDSTLPREERVARNADVWLDIVGRNREAYLASAGQGDAIADSEIRMLIEAGREAAIDRMIANNLDLLDDTPQARFVLRCLLGLNQSACRQWIEGRATRAETHAILTHAFLTLSGPVLRKVQAASAADIAGE